MSKTLSVNWQMRAENVTDEIIENFFHSKKDKFKNKYAVIKICKDNYGIVELESKNVIQRDILSIKRLNVKTYEVYEISFSNGNHVLLKIDKEGKAHISKEFLKILYIFTSAIIVENVEIADVYEAQKGIIYLHDDLLQIVCSLKTQSLKDQIMFFTNGKCTIVKKDLQVFDTEFQTIVFPNTSELFWIVETEPGDWGILRLSDFVMKRGFKRVSQVPSYPNLAEIEYKNCLGDNFEELSTIALINVSNYKFSRSYAKIEYCDGYGIGTLENGLKDVFRLSDFTIGQFAD